MTDRYQAWLQDPVAKQVLETYRAHDLNPGQQLAFERLVDNVGISLSQDTYRKLLKTISEVTGDRQLSINLVSDFKASVRDRDLWPEIPNDPHIRLGEKHPKGPDARPSRYQQYS